MTDTMRAAGRTNRTIPSAAVRSSSAVSALVLIVIN
jgi:hypothetical protein